MMISCGVAFLFIGRIPWVNRKEIRRPASMLVCFLLIVPAVIFIGYYINLFIEAADRNEEPDDREILRITFTIELPTYLGCLLLAALLCQVSAVPQRKMKSERSDDYDDDRYERRPRYRDDDRYDNDDDDRHDRDRDRPRRYRGDNDRRRDRYDRYDGDDRDDDDFDRRDSRRRDDYR
jgi:hypothetical protein